ncbi:MAG: DUF4232 domain-containing protein [Marmoricola sp.]
MSTRTRTLLAVTASAASIGAMALMAPAQAAATPSCGNGDLKAGYVYADSAAGSSYGRIRLTNVSHHACHTGGYAGVSYVGDGDGTQIGHAAVRTNTGAVASYVLRPGQRLVSTLREVRAANFPRSRCSPAAVDGFRVYVPNSTTSQYVKHSTTGCRNSDVHLLFEEPLRRP